MNILVCDDDRAIVDAIEIYLSQEGYTVVKAYDGLDALKKLQENEIQLVLMDVMMPGMDGIRTTMKIRETSSVAIIFLSADDYITKPFNPLELTARVKSLLRRYTQLGAIAENKPAVFRIGGLVMDDERKEVTVDGEPVKLTPIEYRILLLLVQNPGKVFSITQIYERIWNEEALGGDNTVAVHIRHIREKIEINPKEPRYLKVVWGVGYKIDRE